MYLSEQNTSCSSLDLGDLNRHMPCTSIELEYGFSKMNLIISNMTCIYAKRMLKIKLFYR